MTSSFSKRTISRNLSHHPCPAGQPRFQLRTLALLLILSQLSVPAFSQMASGTTNTVENGQRDTKPRYVFRRNHDPNGIGQFYLGREIAQVMSFHGAPWLNRPEREQEEHLSKLISLLDLAPGDEVADIGAGSGVLTELLAKKVGPEGQVFAVDIQKEMLLLIQQRTNRAGLQNVTPVLGGITDPKLAAESVDLMLLVDVYHEFSHPFEMCQAMAEALRPGGRIVLVEYRKEDPRIPIKEIHKMTEMQVKAELGRPEFGLEWVETHDDLPRQHVIVFRKSEPTSAKPEP